MGWVTLAVAAFPTGMNDESWVVYNGAGRFLERLDFLDFLVTPDEQQPFVRDYPAVFEPESGAWGRAGCTACAWRSAN